MAVSSAPFVLHRISEGLIFHAPAISKSQPKKDQFAHCCLTTDDKTPVQGIATEAKGISTIALYNDAGDAAMTAAHALFDAKGDKLVCAVLATDQSISDILLLHDREIPGQEPCADHFLVTPSYCVSREQFIQMGLCTLPEGSWVPCPYMLNGGAECDLQIPEAPDDYLLCLSCNALEDFALDCSKQGNARRAARLAQFHISHLTEWEQLQYHAYLSSVVAEALLRWQDMQFAGFPIATRGHIRAMIQDVSAWKEMNIQDA